MLSIVVLLNINDESAFLEFEKAAIELMARYGGELIAAFKPKPGDSSFGGSDADEIHILQFPDEQAFAAYRSDAELKALSDLRLQAIKSTRIYISDKHVQY